MTPTTTMTKNPTPMTKKTSSTVIYDKNNDNGIIIATIIIIHITIDRYIIINVYIYI